MSGGLHRPGAQPDIPTTKEAGFPTVGYDPDRAGDYRFADDAPRGSPTGIFSTISAMDLRNAVSASPLNARSRRMAYGPASIAAGAVSALELAG